MPGYMWVSCLSAVVRLGAIPVLVDIDNTFCMDPDDLQRKISARSKAIMCVHMSGASGYIDKIAAIAAQHKRMDFRGLTPKMSFPIPSIITKEPCRIAIICMIMEHY